MTPNFWYGKRVFLTGHTGFKGSWMSLWLHALGAKIYGYALPPSTSLPSLFQLIDIEKLLVSNEFGNINDYDVLFSSMQGAQPEILFHFAAQPLVRQSFASPLETYMTNIIGTAHVLDVARKIPSLKSIVVITTDKCYENKEWVWPYRENEPMGGYDPYSSSKACAELVTASYRNSFFDINQIGLATARAGNVIGGGDFSVDRLIPDFIRAIQDNETILLRYPNAIRPWQHVLESLHGYLLLAEKLWKKPQEFSQAWNFGPYDQDTKTVSAITDALINSFGRGVWQQDVATHSHEAHYLKLDIAKAETYLGWRPRLDIDSALVLLVDWYKFWQENPAPRVLQQFTLSQIEQFSQGL